LELAQVASSNHAAVVDAELMDRTLRGEDRSSYPADAIAAADEAKARILELVDDATGVIDGYLAKRYTLPLATTPRILATWARAIVRYRLNKDRQTDERSDPVVRDYRDAIKFLQQVAEGKFSLGVADPEQGPASDGEVRFESGAKVFGRRALP
jgi:phage gp36-like protein